MRACVSVFEHMDPNDLCVTFFDTGGLKGVKLTEENTAQRKLTLSACSYLFPW